MTQASAPVSASLRNNCRKCDRLSEIEKKVISLLAKESEPVNLAKLLENGTMPASDLLNALQSLSRRCLIEQQGSFYDLPLVVKQYIKGGFTSA